MFRFQSTAETFLAGDISRVAPGTLVADDLAQVAACRVR
jgi:hypothetical protein